MIFMCWMRKISNTIIILISATIFTVSCKTESPEFFHTEGGLKYKYQDIVAKGKEPQIGDVLSVKMKWSTIEDSIFYTSVNTGYNGADIVKLQKPNIPGGIEEGFAKLKEGDSVTFYISPDRFFNEYIQADVPDFLIGDPEMKIEIRLLKIQNNKEYQTDLKEWQRLKDFEEFQMIEETLDYWKNSGDSIVEVGGLYIVYDAIENGETVNYNEVFELHYIATFTNGQEFYNTYNNGNPDEFQFGQTGQMVEGLKNAISVMKYGQQAKVLIPSDIGFKGTGSAGNIVPPYTPVIYYLEVLPKIEEDLFIEK